MDIAKTHTSLQVLEEKIELLLQQQQQQKTMMQQLRAENLQLRQQQEKAHSFAASSEIGTIDQGGMGEQDWKDRLDDYIQKIDHCITYIEQHQ